MRCVAAGCHAVDAHVSRFVSSWREGPGAYELRGRCVGCGACCRTPTVLLPTLLWRLPRLRRLVIAWHREVNLFELIEQDRANHALVFRCRHFDPASRRCGCYRTRPGLCRDYPRGLAQAANPEFFEGCGYYAHYRQAEAMRSALAESGLPPEKLAELEERLHLRE